VSVAEPVPVENHGVGQGPGKYNFLSPTSTWGYKWGAQLYNLRAGGKGLAAALLVYMLNCKLSRSSAVRKKMLFAFVPSELRIRQQKTSWVILRACQGWYM